MKIDSNNILAELERLGAMFPWDTVNIWLIRKPEGEVSFTIYIEGNSDMGLHADSVSNRLSLADAMEDIAKRAKNRDPEIARQRKVVELKEQLQKLQSVVFDLPPYRPNRELSQGTLTQVDSIEIDAIPAREDDVPY